jgi:hypothetical protein
MQALFKKSLHSRKWAMFILFAFDFSATAVRLGREFSKWILCANEECYSVKHFDQKERRRAYENRIEFLVENYTERLRIFCSNECRMYKKRGMIINNATIRYGIGLQKANKKRKQNNIIYGG